MSGAAMVVVPATPPASSRGVWSSAEAYEPYMGRWSRLIAQRFVQGLGVQHGRHWLDVGCGTGALTSAIVGGAAPARVIGFDKSDGYLAYARVNAAAPCVSFELGEATRLPHGDGTFDAVVSGLVLNFLEAPAVVVGEMARVAKPGGRVAAYVWDYGEGMEILRRFWDIAVTLDPSAASRDEAVRSDTWRPPVLQRLFVEAGLCEVETTDITLAAELPSFAAYWTPFLGGQGTVASYVTSLAEEPRARLAETLRAALCDAQGKVSLRVRAFAVKGTKSRNQREGV
jgi:SAM-dependent methyltransferase